jgi:large subunit ribosomal protein L21
MYAIVETSGRQFRVEPGATITVDRRPEEAGAEVVLDKVLLVSADDLVVGSPTVSGASVKARVVGHGQGDKVITFKYHHRRRRRRRVGFRAAQTTLEILSIDR